MQDNLWTAHSVEAPDAIRTVVRVEVTARMKDPTYFVIVGTACTPVVVASPYTGFGVLTVPCAVICPDTVGT